MNFPPPPRLSICLFVLWAGLLGPPVFGWEEEESRLAARRGESAAKFIGQRLAGLEDRDFFGVPPLEWPVGYRGFPLAGDASYLEALRFDLRSAFAEIHLARSFPMVNWDESMAIEWLTGSEGRGFFHSDAHLDYTATETILARLDRLAADPALRWPDRIFSLLRDTGESDAEVFADWLDRSRPLADESRLRGTVPLESAAQAHAIRDLYLLSVVLRSSGASRAALSEPLAAERDRLLSELNLAVRTFLRRRFEEDGPLRERSLPVFAAASRLLPGLTMDSAGICTQSTLAKSALQHARGLARLAELIDAPMADTAEARRALAHILDYRVQPYYIGSLEVREKGTLPCPAYGELEMLLNEASFFGKDGHRDESTYQNRIRVLEPLFLRPSASETRDHLFALETPHGWLRHFRETLLHSDLPGKDGALEAIRKRGSVSPRDMKNIFLARCILSHPAFDRDESLRESRDELLTAIGREAPDLAIHHFRNSPESWNEVDLAFLEMSKLIPDFDLAGLAIPTYRDYLKQRNEYRSALREIPQDLIGLAAESSPGLVPDRIGLFQSDYVHRTGKFHHRLHPDFITSINRRLNVILAYRESPFTPPDLRHRPSLARPGSAIRELRVHNRLHPETGLTNPELHDLLEGDEGGLGGLGELCLSDPRDYEAYEPVLDAIARCQDLRLGEVLFALAMDVGIQNPTYEDKAAAVRRWLRYFSRTQSTARFHSTPEELRRAIRGAFVFRLVSQCDSFVEVLQRSADHETGSPDDIGPLFEKTLATQIRAMTSVLSSIDPSTALNKDTEYIKKRWYILKAWHTESIKWLETILAEPVLMAEVTRIRNLSRQHNRSYTEVVPAIARYQSILQGAGPASRSSSWPDPGDRTTPWELASRVMDQLLAVERQGARARVGEVEFVEYVRPGSHLSREITGQLLEELRLGVHQAGFIHLSEATVPEDLGELARDDERALAQLQREELSLLHETLLVEVEAAIAGAKGRIEAERNTDLRVLEDLTLRAARADRIFFAGDPERYSLLIDPSPVLQEWNQRHRIETLAEFRALETRAEAQREILRAREERRQLDNERSKMALARASLTQRLEKASVWADENDLSFNPDSVIDEMITLEDRIVALQQEIERSRQREERLRVYHFRTAHELQRYRLRDRLVADGKDWEEELREAPIELAGREPEEEPPPAIMIAPEPRTSSRASTSRSSNASVGRSDSSSASSSPRGGFFSRIFGGRGRR